MTTDAQTFADDRRPVVVVADDDDEMRELICTRLIRDGMRVVEVEDGFELRDYLTLCRPGGDLPEPDAVISDINMPGEAGPEALSHFELLRAPVVLISAAGPATLSLWARRVHAAATLEKPFELDALSLLLKQFFVTRR